MRTASGFTGAISQAAALAAVPPQKAATGPVIAGTPSFTCDPAGGGAGATTPTDATWHNAVTEEIEAVLQLVGDTCDATDNTQLAQALEPSVKAIKSAVADTGVVSTTNQRVVMGSASCRATGAQAYAAGSNAFTGFGGSVLVSGSTARCDSSVAAAAAIVVSGNESRVDCSTATSAAVTASGGASVVDGCEAAVGAITASGSFSAVRSSRTTALAMTASGTASVIEACSDGFAVTVSGNYSKATACDGATIAGAHNHASASQGPTFPATATFCDVIASGGVVLPANSTACAVLGATGAVTPSGAAPANNQVYGGVGAVALWRIDGTTGAFYSGGGAAPAPGVPAVSPAYSMSGADYLEMFPLLIEGEAIPPRRLVTLSAGKARMCDRGDRLHGAVSTTPGVCGNSPDDGSDRFNDHLSWCPVALVGQVEIETCTEVQPGDFLVAGPNGRGLAAEYPNLRDRRVEVLDVREPFDAAKGCGVALCLVG